MAPFFGYIFSRDHAWRRAAGVFNLVNGDGPTVGAAMSSHPDVDMVSFTGSTRAGIEVAKAAAPTVKRVAQELGGKSPNIVLDDDAFAKGDARGVGAMMPNSGQSCNAPSRMLVPKGRMDEAITVAREAASQVTVGDPNGNSALGPVVSKTQFDKIQGLIQKGIDEGATLVSWLPSGGLDKGYYVSPPSRQRHQRMTIARGDSGRCCRSGLRHVGRPSISATTPVWPSRLCQSGDIERPARWPHPRAGQVSINGGGGMDPTAPFGGYKMSGNGREWGDFAFHEFLETKAVLGYAPKVAAE